MSPNDPSKERRHWRAFWDEFPGWFRTAIIALSSAGASAAGMKHLGGTQPNVLMDEDDWKRVVAEAIEPLKREQSKQSAGFKAFVSTQPDKVQVIVFKAMDRQEERSARGGN